MSFRASRSLLALRANKPLLKEFGRWDPRMFGSMMRPFNWREMSEGYVAHSIVGWMEDFQGNQTMPTKPFWARFYRVYGFMLFFWFAGWAFYLFKTGLSTPGCPWSVVYDPSRERAF